VENLTVSNVTPYGFRLSWDTKQQQQQQQQEGGAPSGGSFKHFHVVVTDSGWLLEPHEFMVPGNQTFLDLWGLITGIGYEVRLTGVSRSGLLSRPLTTVAVTGTSYSSPDAYLMHIFLLVSHLTTGDVMAVMMTDASVSSTSITDSHRSIYLHSHSIFLFFRLINSLLPY